MPAILSNTAQLILTLALLGLVVYAGWRLVDLVKATATERLAKVTR